MWNHRELGQAKNLGVSPFHGKGNEHMLIPMYPVNNLCEGNKTL